MKMNKTLLALTILFVFAACFNSGEYEKIAGEWECTRWIDKETKRDKCNDNVYFKFSEDQSYISEFGMARDTGEYRIANDILYVTPKDKKEFGVKLTTLNRDTVEFLMNRSGVEEILTLVRKE